MFIAKTCQSISQATIAHPVQDVYQDIVLHLHPLVDQVFGTCTASWPPRKPAISTITITRQTKHERTKRIPIDPMASMPVTKSKPENVIIA
jgi:hypothetical protein